MNHSHWNYLPTRSFEGDDTGVEMMRPEADEAMNTLTADVAAAGRAKTRGKMVGLWGFHPKNMGNMVVLWDLKQEKWWNIVIWCKFDDDYDDLKCGKSMKEWNPLETHRYFVGVDGTLKWHDLEWLIGFRIYIHWFEWWSVKGWDR